jgi:hypothetical protein
LDTQSTNKSVQRINNVILPKAYEDQRKFGNKSLWLGLLSVVFIGIILLKEYRDHTDSKVQELSLKSDSLRLEVQNFRLSLESINSSIQKATTDTFLVKKRR